jgi:hypothetical protein
MKPEETTEEWELLDALRTLASEEERLGTPPRVEARLMRAFDERRMHGHRRLFARHVLEAAAMLALVVFGAYWWNRGAAETPASDNQIADAAIATPWSSSDALMWLDPEPDSLQIVHVRVAPAVLAAQGYAIGDADSDALVDLEVILGADGMPRGVRVARAGAPAY